MSGSDAVHELVLTRLIDASRDNVWRCWTEPELLVKWFAPRPWETSSASIDLRPGGANLITMRNPDGEEFPSRGVYLEVIANEKLVFTDAYIDAWTPAENPFFTANITFEDEGGKTRYTARALHWKEEDRAAHEKMGFHEGWGQCAEQLEEVARTL